MQLPYIPPRGQRGGAGPGQGLDAFAQLFQDGSSIACVRALSTEGIPRITTDLATTVSAVHRTVPAAQGSGHWRVLAIPVRANPADQAVSGREVVVVAVPTSGLDEAMTRLVHIELFAAAGLLVALGLGAWLILRNALRPLEDMSRTAATISAGDLSQRVRPADGHSEVGQLGLALNTMLDDIEVAFREREATEQRLRQFLADASHELRTPITSIHGFAEMFRLGSSAAGLAPAEVMDRIEAESARMRSLVEDLLLLARLDEVRPLRAERSTCRSSPRMPAPTRWPSTGNAGSSWMRPNP